MIHHVAQGAERAKDYILAGALTSAPIWAPVMNHVNIILTTLTLIIGLIIGGLRLFFLIRDRISLRVAIKTKQVKIDKDF